MGKGINTVTSIGFLVSEDKKVGILINLPPFPPLQQLCPESSFECFYLLSFTAVFACPECVKYLTFSRPFRAYSLEPNHLALSLSSVHV